MGMHGFGLGGFGTFGWLGMIINLVITIGVIIGVVLLIVWIVRQAAGGAGVAAASAGTSSPREVLQVRYARGEITREQYQQILADLQ